MNQADPVYRPESPPGRGGSALARSIARAGSWLAVTLAACLAVLPLSPPGTLPVRADTAVVVGLDVPSATLTPGNEVVIELVADMCPSLSSFGPVEIRFDPGVFSFLSVERAAGVPDTFSLEHAATADGKGIRLVGQDESAGQDRPIPQGDRVRLARLAFRVLSNAPTGPTRLAVPVAEAFESAEGFTLLTVTEDPNPVVIGEAGPVRLELADLYPDRGFLSPAFDPDVTEYELSIPAGVTDIRLTAIPLDDRVTVAIEGDGPLQWDSTRITIRVSDPDGHVRTTLLHLRFEGGTPTPPPATTTPSPTSVPTGPDTTPTPSDAASATPDPTGMGTATPTTSVRPFDAYRIPLLLGMGLLALVLLLLLLRPGGRSGGRGRSGRSGGSRRSTSGGKTSGGKTPGKKRGRVHPKRIP